MTTINQTHESIGDMVRISIQPIKDRVTHHVSTQNPASKYGQSREQTRKFLERYQNMRNSHEIRDDVQDDVTGASSVDLSGSTTPSRCSVFNDPNPWRESDLRQRINDKLAEIKPITWYQGHTDLQQRQRPPNSPNDDMFAGNAMHVGNASAHFSGLLRSDGGRSWRNATNSKPPHADTIAEREVDNRVSGYPDRDYRMGRNERFERTKDRGFRQSHEPRHDVPQSKPNQMRLQRHDREDVEIERKISKKIDEIFERARQFPVGSIPELRASETNGERGQNPESQRNNSQHSQHRKVREMARVMQASQSCHESQVQSKSELVRSDATTGVTGNIGRYTSAFHDVPEHGELSTPLQEKQRKSAIPDAVNQSIQFQQSEQQPNVIRIAHNELKTQILHQPAECTPENMDKIKSRLDVNESEVKSLQQKISILELKNAQCQDKEVNCPMSSQMTKDKRVCWYQNDLREKQELMRDLRKCEIMKQQQTEEIQKLKDEWVRLGWETYLAKNKSIDIRREPQNISLSDQSNGCDNIKSAAMTSRLEIQSLKRKIAELDVLSKSEIAYQKVMEERDKVSNHCQMTYCHEMKDEVSNHCQMTQTENPVQNQVTGPLRKENAINMYTAKKEICAHCACGNDRRTNTRCPECVECHHEQKRVGHDPNDKRPQVVQESQTHNMLPHATPCGRTNQPQLKMMEPSQTENHVPTMIQVTSTENNIPKRSEIKVNFQETLRDSFDHKDGDTKELPWISTLVPTHFTPEDGGHGDRVTLRQIGIGKSTRVFQRRQKKKGLFRRMSQTYHGRNKKSAVEATYHFSIIFSNGTADFCVVSKEDRYQYLMNILNRIPDTEWNRECKRDLKKMFDYKGDAIFLEVDPDPH